jgi:hypothetical protein
VELRKCAKCGRALICPKKIPVYVFNRRKLCRRCADAVATGFVPTEAHIHEMMARIDWDRVKKKRRR